MTNKQNYFFSSSGIPSTLNYIDLTRTPSGSPELIPYPDWTSNTPENCPVGLNTVYRIKADQCGRLWVLDTGTIGIGNTTRNVCPYSLNVYDLNTNTRIRRYELRPEDTNADTFIANIAIDIGRDCDDTFAYMSDELGYGLITYSWMENKSWRFEHSFFFPDPLRGDFNVAGLNFQWGEEGIFGLALSPINSDGYRTLYFSPLASYREFKVSTRVLRFEANTETSFHDFAYLPERGPDSHTTARVMDETGVMLYNLIGQNSVGCWHESMPYSPEFHGVVDRDDVGLVFPSDVKIDENRNVWVMSDRMPVFLITELDYNDINFRIYMAPLDELIAGTVCDVADARKNAVGRFLQDAPRTTLNAVTPTRFLGNNAFDNHFRSRFQNYQKAPVTGLSPGYTVTQFGQTRPQTFTGYAKSGDVSLYSPVASTAAAKSPAPIPKAYVFNTHNNVRLQTTGTGAAPATGVFNFSPQQTHGPSADSFTDHGSWWSRRSGFF